MKKAGEILGKCFLLLIAGGILGAFLLTVVFCIPVNEEMAAQSEEINSLEGNYPYANVVSGHGGDIAYFTGFSPIVLDNATDARMLLTALQRDASPLIRAMDMCDYPRYWHGYVLILRPLLYIMNYGDIRVLNCFFQIALFVLTALLLWKRLEKKRYILALLTSYVLLMPVALLFSLQYSWIFYVIFGGILFVICKNEILLQKSN